jgi:hypothetical protein
LKILSADKNRVIDSINECGQFANCGALQKILQGDARKLQAATAGTAARSG